MDANNKDRLEKLGERPVGRLLWEYSVPAVVGMLVMALYNVVDRIFIGQWVGPDAIAGLAVTFPIMNLATAIGVLVGVGSSSRVSIVLGAGDDASCRADTRQRLHSHNGECRHIHTGVHCLYRPYASRLRRQ